VTERIPVTLLTGFLGSGKTTLLRELLRSPAMSDAAVIVNEFGEVGLDHLLIEKGAEDVVLLDSGCLCCTVSDGLGETLEDLHYRRLRKEIPQFSRVVIETSGLAEPAPIMHLLLADPAVVRWYVLDGVVTTVDSVLGAQQLEAQTTSRKQVAVADSIILTKTDVAGAQDILSVEQALERINPRAPRIRAAHGDIDPGCLTGLVRPGSNAMPRWLRADAPAGVAPRGRARRRRDGQLAGRAAGGKVDPGRFGSRRRSHRHRARPHPAGRARFGLARRDQGATRAARRGVRRQRLRIERGVAIQPRTDLLPVALDQSITAIDDRF